MFFMRKIFLLNLFLFFVNLFSTNLSQHGFDQIPLHGVNPFTKEAVVIKTFNSKLRSIESSKNDREILEELQSLKDYLEAMKPNPPKITNFDLKSKISILVSLIERYSGQISRSEADQSYLDGLELPLSADIKDYKKEYNPYNYVTLTLPPLNTKNLRKYVLTAAQIKMNR